MRYLWDHYHQYTATAGRLTAALMPLLFPPAARLGYVASAARVDRYRRQFELHPPAHAPGLGRDLRRWSTRRSDTSLFAPSATQRRHYLWVGQMTPYKRADLAVDAFNALELPLLMVGDGEMAGSVEPRAGPTSRSSPARSSAGCAPLMPMPRAHLHRRGGFRHRAGRGDGVGPAGARLTARGGALDSDRRRASAVCSSRSRRSNSLIDGVRAMEAWLPDFDPEVAVLQASRFSPAAFDAGILRSLM